MRNRAQRLSACIAVLGFCAIPIQSADAAVTITGTVDSSGQTVVTSSPVHSSGTDTIKIVFKSLTSGVTLQLCGNSRIGALHPWPCNPLATSSGPGGEDLLIIGASQLSGQVLFVNRASGNANAQFSLTIE